MSELPEQENEHMYYDKTTRKRKQRAGDKVLILLPVNKAKLLAKWRDPYEVVLKLNNVNYVIRTENIEKKFPC